MPGCREPRRGDLLAGTAEGRQSERDITIFDSTGLAIQDLAITLAAMERADEIDGVQPSTFRTPSRVGRTHTRYGELSQEKASIRMPSGSKAKNAQ